MSESALLTAMTKAFVFYIGILAFSMGLFGLVCILAIQANFSINGCSILIAASLPIWAWACLRSEEPALRTLASMLIYSGMLVSLFFALGLVKSFMASQSSARPWHIGLFVLAVGAFWYLRSVVVRRNKRVDAPSNRTDAV